jgi:hypothetical protein
MTNLSIDDNITNFYRNKYFVASLERAFGAKISYETEHQDYSNKIKYALVINDIPIFHKQPGFDVKPIYTIEEAIIKDLGKLMRGTLIKADEPGERGYLAKYMLRQNEETLMFGI